MNFFIQILEAVALLVPDFLGLGLIGALPLISTVSRRLAVL